MNGLARARDDGSSWRALWPALLGALAFRLAAFALMTALALWSELRPAPSLPDVGLNVIPYVPWVGRINYLAWLCLYLPLAIALLCSEPRRWIRYMVTGGLVSLARGVCIALTGLGVPDAAHAGAGIGTRGFGAAYLDLISPVAIFFGDGERAYLTKDLFFSGHTATTFLLVLYLWRRPRLRAVALVAHAIVVLTVLFAHLHYMIDIVGAYAFTFAIFAAREWRAPDARKANAALVALLLIGSTMLGCRAPATGEARGQDPTALAIDAESSAEPTEASLEPAPLIETADTRTDEHGAAAPRPARWAQPLQLAGVPNLHRVTPTLWRGAQPTAEGIAALERAGVKTVLSLRAFHSDSLLVGCSVTCKRISFKSWHPEREDVLEFLKIVTDPARQPVFVHCKHGADRTGMMIAIHRIVVEGWTKDEAIVEMTEGGYGFHSIWQNIVRFVRELDVEDLERELGKS